jgi:hypothetical protein
MADFSLREDLFLPGSHVTELHGRSGDTPIKPSPKAHIKRNAQL